MRIIQSELSKLMSLPSTWIACAAGIITPVAIAVLTSLTSPPDGNTGFSELAIGVVGGNRPGCFRNWKRIHHRG